MLKEVKKVAPIIFKNAGPTCKQKIFVMRIKEIALFIQSELK